MNPDHVKRCREKLIAVAKKRDVISFGDLAKHIGVPAQSIGRYLNAVYNDLVVTQDLPDLTLVAVKSGSHYGRYNSTGAPAQSVVFDESNLDARELYDKERERVYQQWGAETET